MTDSHTHLLSLFPLHAGGIAFQRECTSYKQTYKTTLYLFGGNYSSNGQPRIGYPANQVIVRVWSFGPHEFGNCLLLDKVSINQSSEEQK